MSDMRPSIPTTTSAIETQLLPLDAWHRARGGRMVAVRRL